MVNNTAEGAHIRERLPMSTEVEDEGLDLPHSFPECEGTFPMTRGLAGHRARWCRPEQRLAFRRGDQWSWEASRSSRSTISTTSCAYLVCRFTCDVDDAVDMRHCMAIAGERSRGLDYLAFPSTFSVCT